MVDLDVLPRRDVALVQGRVLIDDVGEHLHLLRRHAAHRELDAAHLDVGLTLAVDALLQAEADELVLRGLAVEELLGLVVEVVELARDDRDDVSGRSRRPRDFRASPFCPCPSEAWARRPARAGAEHCLLWARSRRVPWSIPLRCKPGRRLQSMQSTKARSVLVLIGGKRPGIDRGRVTWWPRCERPHRGRGWLHANFPPHEPRSVRSRGRPHARSRGAGAPRLRTRPPTPPRAQGRR